MDTSVWYQTLLKPAWSPPSWVFGPVWSVLYAVIAVSFGYVGFLFFKGRVPGTTVLPFALNLIFNFAFTPLQFRLQNNYLAAIDILLVLATLIWAMVSIWPYARWVTYASIPYLAGSFLRRFFSCR